MSTAEANLSGTVTDSSTGDPISDVSIAIFSDSTNKKSTAKTDSSGAYSIESVAVGSYTIEVEGPNPYTKAVDKTGVELQAGDNVQNFTLKKQSTESITKVSTEEGTGVGGTFGDDD